MTVTAEKLGSRRSRTRTALLDAGQRLLAERPVDAVSVDEIVLAAGVAKGSFFNHFGDKHEFAKAIATQIREECEAEIGRINAGEADPLRRLSGGMLAAVHFALARRKQAQVMLRASTLATARDHPLNRGLLSDIEAAAAAGQLREEGREAALLFWLGACNMLMINVIERRFSRGDAAARMQAMMLLALTGLGVSERLAAEIAETRAAQLEEMG